MKHKTLALIGLVALIIYSQPALAGKLPSSPDGTVKAVAEALSAHQPQILWQALPASYQNDITEITQQFAAKMDPEAYNKVFSVLQKAVDLLQGKKEFILGSSFLENVEVDREQLDKGYDSVVGLLEIVLNSEISKIDSLKSLDFEKFLSGTGAKIMDQVAVISKASPDDPYAKEFKTKLSGATYELISEDGDSAVVKVTSGDDESEEINLVRIEGRWVPKELADEWAQDIGQAKQGLADMSEEEIAQSKMQVMMTAAMAESLIDQLAATSTQEEFEALIGGLLGGLFGGGGEEPQEEIEIQATDDEPSEPEG
jgi:hypothetical protein